MCAVFSVGTSRQFSLLKTYRYIFFLGGGVELGNMQKATLIYLCAIQVVEVLATDDDDRSKGNGPSFVFRMDPNAADIIRASFKVEHDPSRSSIL